MKFTLREWAIAEIPDSGLRRFRVAALPRLLALNEVTAIFTTDREAGTGVTHRQKFWAGNRSMLTSPTASVRTRILHPLSANASLVVWPK
jgi:hypothetical protein